MPCVEPMLLSEEEDISMMLLVRQWRRQFSTKCRDGQEFFNLATWANLASCTAWWHNICAAARIDNTCTTWKSTCDLAFPILISHLVFILIVFDAWYCNFDINDHCTLFVWVFTTKWTKPMKCMHHTRGALSIVLGWPGRGCMISLGKIDEKFECWATPKAMACK